MKKFIMAIIAVMMMMVPTMAAEIQPSHTLYCGSYATMYWYDGDENTDMELMVVGKTKATFYLTTKYGEVKMTKPRVDGEFKRTTAWNIKYNNGEFYSTTGITKVVTEANNILDTIE